MNKSLSEYVLLLFVSTIAMQWCKTEQKFHNQNYFYISFTHKETSLKGQPQKHTYIL